MSNPQILSSFGINPMIYLILIAGIVIGLGAIITVIEAIKKNNEKNKKNKS